MGPEQAPGAVALADARPAPQDLELVDVGPVPQARAVAWVDAGPATQAQALASVDEGLVTQAEALAVAAAPHEDVVGHPHEVVTADGAKDYVLNRDDADVIRPARQ